MARLSRRTILALALVLVGIAHTEAKSANSVKNLGEAAVGRFKVNINDDRLPLEDMEKNKTSLKPALDNLWYSVYDYWDTYSDEETPTEEEQSRNLSNLAKAELTKEEYQKFNEVLLNASKEQAEQTPLYEGQPHHDVVVSYLDAIWNLTSQTEYYIYGAYLGVGRSSSCAENINEILSNKDEWEKMGSSAATTLMALLPTFLAFGNLFVPRSSEAYTTSALVGLTTAFFTFGLPVKSMSAVKQSNVHTLAVFGIATLAYIATLGGMNKDGTASRREKLTDLQSWSDQHNGDEVKARFVAIKTLVNKWEKRWHLWHAPAALVAVAQILVFALAIYPLFEYLGVPKFIFDCRYEQSWNWTGLYLGVSAGVNTLLRYIMWESSNHERVKVYSLSDAAQTHLNNIISNTDIGETTATHLPPLYPPYLLSLRGSITQLFSRQAATSSSVQQQPKQGGIFSDTIKLVRRRLSYIFKGRNYLDVIKAGFIGRTMSARRWRPVYILIHLSTEGRNPLITLFTGFIEASLLLVLTFFFAAQWGGNLVLTMIALVLLLVFITLGRMLGLVYVWLSSQVWGLTVVNCDSVEEIRGVLRIVCSMEGVLVFVNGATYFGGYRMDGRDGYNDFIELHERGEFDEGLRGGAANGVNTAAAAVAKQGDGSVDDVSFESKSAETGMQGVQVSSQEAKQSTVWSVKDSSEKRGHEVV